MPLHRRVPKRGFHNPFRVEYEVVNLDTLVERFEAGADDHAGAAARAGLVAAATARSRCSARGDVSKALTVQRAQVQRQGGGEDCRGRRHGRGRSRSGEAAECAAGVSPM